MADPPDRETTARGGQFGVSGGTRHFEQIPQRGGRHPGVNQMRPHALLLGTCIIPLQLGAQEPLPIIDMHLHAFPADHQGPPPLALCVPFDPFPAWDPARPFGATFLAIMKQPTCEDPIWSPATDDSVMAQTIGVMERRHIVGVLSGTPERVAAWMAAAPGRFFPGLGFQLGRDTVSPDSLRALHAAGHLAVLAEVSNQYAGIAPDDERMEPYWALAEELDIPVGIHVGTGPPGAIYLGMSGYRARLHSALTMEEVLVRHPRLRVYLMHAGYPLLDDLLALLYGHPQVYVDVGVIVYTQPRAAFYRFLRGIVESGFGNRVMFGSDQMVWPGVIEPAIAVIEEAPFLSTEQKRAILYDNAARFLRLSQEEIARHHRR
jgi:predicted TIM-barrel fold metal-dependent hydrolase